MQYFVRLTALFLLSLAAVGCNTVEGVGQDVEEVGEEIEDASTY
ncbi:glutamyl-tRNA synthetase [Parvularcula bermudensis HTCC2503]|uniref:Glutamyl-tRNA synthetase n=1 Tax=Parvularcula bermudensis (strain ATCC BAA-594 / HTCC2503 / KCTC 12087) TaxID=314260 RepID=E0TFG2_PARBH|nr:entericidin A/B family lipoprotein [Parvularcula bermudensis]ADM10086.1 glutamyl-tRNA synthetase [Parvularcula bermudensis HTCC2503]